MAAFHHHHYPTSTSATPSSNTNTTTAPRIPDSLTSYFTLHILETRFLPLCTTCQSAVLPKSLFEHLRKIHDLPISLRDEVRSLVAALPLATRSLDFVDVKDEIEQVAGLKVVDAWICRVRKGEEEGGKECGFIRKDVTDVRRHVNAVHGVSARGNHEVCKAQSWFAGRRAQYWRICEDEGVEKEADSGGDKDVVMKNTVNEKQVDRDEARNEGSTKIIDVKSNVEVLDTDCEDGTGEKKKLQTSIFTSVCRWGFYGKGFGDKTPKSWRVGEERELGVGMMF